MTVNGVLLLNAQVYGVTEQGQAEVAVVVLKIGDTQVATWQITSETQVYALLYDRDRDNELEQFIAAKLAAALTAGAGEPAAGPVMKPGGLA